ncbi:glucokinase [Erythrobacter sp. HL-111]|uniref:glucokinase n=1 Tax=Erythrobacter sp. HL-111 TaxID=1798193 RepID=UPI0006DA0D9D|nr:glucokinase [Erythrobacter sp. HL-111]KPP88920.1 MAG: glucokinase Glk [Erythrobacteraceae bacterium HL-111]SDT05308.1 glucokinase [Erythrobacter sp. HL-111]
MNPPAREIAVADIGGTNARFARARRGADGRAVLSEPVVLATGDYPDLPSAWRAFREREPGFAPAGAAFALAGPVGEGPFKLTNADWRFDPDTLPDELGVEHVTLLNDFAAIAHAVAGLGPDHLAHLAGPQGVLPESGTVTVIGPGTGLGIAHFRWHEGRALVQATEGSHIDFAPVSPLDDAILAALRRRFGRVSVERVLSGEGIVPIQSALAERDGLKPAHRESLAIWKAGMAGEDPLAQRAVAHFIATLGRIAGDYALAHGAGAVVIAGGLGQRLERHLCEPAFHEAFIDKGRYAAMMKAIPLALVKHPQPGLLGAALAHDAR